MQLTEIIKAITYKNLYNFDNKDHKITNICLHTENINEFSIFVVESKKFKNNNLKNILKIKPKALLTNFYYKNISIPQIIVEDLNFNVSIVLDMLLPCKPINSVGITGTNGKTSVLWFVSKICSINNIKSKTLGTLGYYMNSIKKKDVNLTTPDLDILYKYSHSKKINKYNFIFEVSSHALDQNRIYNFPIDIAALTNITQDHLDYHKTFTNYKKAKFKLFTKKLIENGYAILNDNIEGIKQLKDKIKNKCKIITYGKKQSDVHFKNNKNIVNFRIFKKNYKKKINLISKIELENISCAIACCICLGIKIPTIIKSLDKLTNPPGRLEEINISNNSYRVYIDYAHSPDALKNILINKTIEGKKPNLVFGCGGDRDKSKRALMGKIANMYAQKVYITNDNPRY